jgi:hypothetical protein
VYQNADRNSGIWGGKFLERKKQEKDGEQRNVVESDFQIGGLIKLGAFTFQLLSADNFTIQYMSEREERFPSISPEKAIAKVRALAQQHRSYDDFLVWVLKGMVCHICSGGPRQQGPTGLRRVLHQFGGHRQADPP